MEESGKRFRSNGKLMLSGEYLVLHGAWSLAVPTVLGQSLRVKEIDKAGFGKCGRSFFWGFVTWGNLEGIEHTSDEFATPLADNVGHAFTSLCDAILIISPDKKSVSSNQGHALMEHHPYAGGRYLQARINITDLRRAIIGNDIKTFIRITNGKKYWLSSWMNYWDTAARNNG